MIRDLKDGLTNLFALFILFIFTGWLFVPPIIAFHLIEAGYKVTGIVILAIYVISIVFLSYGDGSPENI